MNSFVFRLASVALLAGAIGSVDAGPVSNYYVTAGDQGTNWILQGTSATSFAQAHPGNFGEYGIAVSGGSVRTLGNANDQVNFGAQYTLGGTYTGVDYSYPLSGAAFYDGTTDGVHNYSVDFFTGTVYQMSLDWSSSVSLFATGAGSGGNLGITYDPTNNSLWISRWNNSTVSNFSLSGSLLSSFTGPATSLSALALDFADGTLWMGTQNVPGLFYQYSKSGTLLSTESYSTLSGQNTLGGEFNFVATSVPEPATMTMLGLGVVGLFGYGALRRRSTAI